MVIALDKGKRPLGFITERRTRKLMEARRACVYRYFPFVLIIKDVDARQIPESDAFLPVIKWPGIPAQQS